MLRALLEHAPGIAPSMLHNMPRTNGRTYERTYEVTCETEIASVGNRARGKTGEFGAANA